MKPKPMKKQSKPNGAGESAPEVKTRVSPQQKAALLEIERLIQREKTLNERLGVGVGATIERARNQKKLEAARAVAGGAS